MRANKPDDMPTTWRDVVGTALMVVAIVLVIAVAVAGIGWILGGFSSVWLHRAVESFCVVVSGSAVMMVWSILHDTRKANARPKIYNDSKEKGDKDE